MDLERLAAALDEADRTGGTCSLSVPATLARAVSAAAALGLAPDVEEFVSEVLRKELESLARKAGLEQIFATYPASRPTLAEVSQALAELECNPLTDHPGLIRQAAAEVVHVRPEADADDVLLWATQLLLHQTRIVRSEPSAST